MIAKAQSTNGRADAFPHRQNWRYWLARYMERADFLVRAIQASRRLAALPKAYGGEETEWGKRAAVILARRWPCGLRVSSR